MNDSVTEKVLAILAKVKRIPREKITLDSPLQELGLDSLDTLILLAELEEQFKITISDGDARSIRCVRDIVAGVRKLAGDLSIDSAAPAD